MSILEFEYLMFSIIDHHCDNCHTNKLLKYNRRIRSSLCEYCKNQRQNSNTKCIKSPLERGLLPVWYSVNSDTGKTEVHYHLPDELKGLLLGKKLLIQEYATIMPIVHIYMGALGIKGHTCSFFKELSSVVKELPRMSASVVYMVRTYQNGKGIHDVKMQHFKI